MGMFDSVYADCPRCGHRNEFQSKEGECCLHSYTVETAPTYVLIDVLNEPQFCAGCKGWFALYDPAYPPGPPKRPNPTAVLVREPTEGEFSVYTHRPDMMRWWDAPFTLDDIECLTPAPHCEEEKD